MQMTKCDFCDYSVMKDGRLCCQFDRCRESTGKVRLMSELAVKANIRLEQARSGKKVNIRKWDEDD